MLLETVYQVLMLSIFVILSIKADCDSPPSISNSKNNITDSNTAPYPHGTLVRYDCTSGYNTAGTSRYFTCNNTDWTGGNIRCERIYCSYVSPPENGKVINTPTNEVGTLIKFACNEGHDMSGSDEILCRTDGNWNPPTAPTCTARDCGEFGSIQYASLFQDNSETERNHYGSVVEVTCQNGYVLNGPPRVKCEANGQWGEWPTCASLQCSAYPNINASCISNSELIGMFYFILCKENISTRTGPFAAECVDGDWDTEEMACFCDCKLPSYNKSFISISNLNSHGNLPHNTKLKWTCNSGSFTYQDSYILCTDGKLRVFKHGNEISNSDYANVSDISHTTFSEICLLPSTTASTTTPTKPPTTQLQTTLTSSSGTTESLTNDNTTNSDFSDRPSTSTPGNKAETTTINMGSTAVFMMSSVVMSDATSRTTPPTTPLQTTLTSSSGTTESFTDDNTTNFDFSDRPSTSTQENKADCDSPPSISNSKNNITDSNTAPYPHGTLVRYDCTSGYNTAGTSRYFTCNNTYWTGGNIRCERIYCSYVEPPENGKVINTPTNEVGTLIKFACNEGHDMSGSDEMLCRTDGNWNPPTAPTCTARDCGEFGSIQYASLFQDNSETERNHYGSVVEVTCQMGYVLNGPPRVKCEANSQWGKQPTCESLSCPPYPNINASCVEKTQMLGTFYFIQCKEESTRTGPDAAECVDGDWDTEDIACFCDCKLPSYNKSFISISNLNSHGNLPHNTKLKWTCNSGSFKYQDSYILCTDGKFRVFKHGNEISNSDYANVSDISHTTFSEICLMPSTTASTTTPTKQPTTQLQTTLTSSSGTTESLTNDNTTNSDFSDRPSTSTPGNKAETTTINMGSTAVFMMSSVVMSDATSRTTPPTTPLQTTLTSSSGTTESFTDNNTTNFDFSDRPSTSTQENKADCDSPPSIFNSKNNITDSNTAPYPHGTLVRYDCNSGYNTAGTSRYFTCNNTYWTGGNIRCERIYCSYVEPPENGKVINTPTNEVGTLIKFACNEGHDMSGSDEMLCRTDGNWNPPTAPTCTARDCGEFGSIQYASLFQDNSETERNHYGSVVEVTCQMGYVLNGPPRVKCEANSQWGKQPTCESLSCPPYPNINASCVEKTQMLGTFYFIQCKEESTRTGPDAAECVDGDWDTEDIACFCDCKLPGYNKSFISISNLNSHGNLPHNTKLKWTCNSGSFKYQDSYILCTDGKFRVFKHGNEISNTDYANVSDISNITFSDICLSPSTSTTIKMGSAAVFMRSSVVSFISAVWISLMYLVM